MRSSARFVGATILMVIGLAALWQAAPRGGPRLVTAVLLMLAVWWNLGLIALFGAGLMDRQRLELRRNGHAASDLCWVRLAKSSATVAATSSAWRSLRRGSQ